MISECTFDLSLQKVHYYLLFINYRVERSFADALIFSFLFSFWQVHAFFFQRVSWSSSRSNTSSRSRWTPGSEVLLDHLQDDTASSSTQAGKNSGLNSSSQSISDPFLIHYLQCQSFKMSVYCIRNSSSFSVLHLSPSCHPFALQLPFPCHNRSDFVQHLRNQKGGVQGGQGEHSDGGIRDPFSHSLPSFLAKVRGQ